MQPSPSGHSATGAGVGPRWCDVSVSSASPPAAHGTAGGPWPRPFEHLLATPRPTSARKPFCTLQKIVRRRNAGSDAICGSGTSRRLLETGSRSATFRHCLRSCIRVAGVGSRPRVALCAAALL